MNFKKFITNWKDKAEEQQPRPRTSVKKKPPMDTLKPFVPPKKLYFSYIDEISAPGAIPKLQKRDSKNIHKNFKSLDKTYARRARQRQMDAGASLIQILGAEIVKKVR